MLSTFNMCTKTYSPYICTGNCFLSVLDLSRKRSLGTGRTSSPTGYSGPTAMMYDDMIDGVLHRGVEVVSPVPRIAKSGCWSK